MKNFFLALLMVLSLPASAQFVSIPTGIYWPFAGSPGRLWGPGVIQPTLATANDEHVSIGNVSFVGRPTGAQTLDTTAKVGFVTGAVTFANAGTSITICIQGVSVADGPIGRPDGVCKGGVTKVLTGGTDTIVASSYNEVTLDTAGTSFTLTQGDLIAVSIKMTSKGGSDSVVIQTGLPLSAVAMRPITNMFTGGTWQTTSAAGAGNSPMVSFITNTTTPVLGTLGGTFSLGRSYTTRSYAVGSTPNEYATIFRVPVTSKVDALWTTLRLVTGNTSDSVVTLYSDCESTPPTTVATVDLLAETLGVIGNEGVVVVPLASQVTLLPNVDYCVGLQATGAGQVRFTEMTLPTDTWRAFIPGGPTLRGVSRSSTGSPFASSLTATVYPMGVRISEVLSATSMGGVF